MDVLTRQQLDEFEQIFTDAFLQESKELTPDEFRESVIANEHKILFAQSFAEYAPEAWEILVGLKEWTALWMQHRFLVAQGKSIDTTPTKVVEESGTLQFLIEEWMKKFGISTPWVNLMALITVRAHLFHEAFSFPPPATLLHNTLPTLVVEGDEISLSHSSFKLTPESTVVVHVDIGQQTWDTLSESPAVFKNRMRKAFAQQLDEYLADVQAPAEYGDLDVKAHWVQMTIMRYAGKRSIRSIATAFHVSRPAVTKAVEITRKSLGFGDLPSEWGATTAKRLELHETKAEK